jgi:hypothetical protein
MTKEEYHEALYQADRPDPDHRCHHPVLHSLSLPLVASSTTNGGGSCHSPTEYFASWGLWSPLGKLVMFWSAAA